MGWFPFKHRRRSQHELAVVEALLTGEDTRHALLLRQFDSCRNLTRKASGPRFEARLGSTTEDLLFDLEESCSSEGLAVETVDNRLLKFHVEVLRGGFLGALVGVAVDDLDWPARWTPRDVVSGQDGTRVYLHLPAVFGPETIRAALSALGVESGQLDLSRVTLRPGREGTTTTALGRLSAVSDGIILPGLDILPERDRYGLELNGRRALVISDLREDGALVVGAEEDDEDAVTFVPSGAHGQSDCRVVATDVLELLRRVAMDPGLVERLRNG